mmetsp:Transcript_24797/g.69461  ORF Transcript_24797/g.69461 Transcript_24797/m.69461 type:complete len:268 (-) Transcript_24797:1523-2326(-)
MAFRKCTPACFDLGPKVNERLVQRRLRSVAQLGVVELSPKPLQVPRKSSHCPPEGLRINSIHGSRLTVLPLLLFQLHLPKAKAPPEVPVQFVRASKAGDSSHRVVKSLLCGVVEPPAHAKVQIVHREVPTPAVASKGETVRVVRPVLVRRGRRVVEHPHPLEHGNVQVVAVPGLAADLQAPKRLLLDRQLDLVLRHADQLQIGAQLIDQVRPLARDHKVDIGDVSVAIHRVPDRSPHHAHLPHDPRAAVQIHHQVVHGPAVDLGRPQ